MRFQGCAHATALDLRHLNGEALVPAEDSPSAQLIQAKGDAHRYSCPAFAAAGRVLNQEIRYRKAEAVTRSLKDRRTRVANQGAVWDGVSKALFALGAASPTSALSAAETSVTWMAPAARASSRPKGSIGDSGPSFKRIGVKVRLRWELGVPSETLSNSVVNIVHLQIGLRMGEGSRPPKGTGAVSELP
jgi:ARG and Rhodanese-Phosphatase-superfamily-associated Protein domain